MNMEDRDYKYVMQDFSNLYLGARYTYDELLEAEELPFKVKSMINRFVKPEIQGENLSLESHLYYMEEKDFVYQTFRQLKAKVKISILQEKNGPGGKTKKQYQTRTIPLQELVKIPPSQKEEKGIMIQEISFSKLALMGL